jgi:hypothetical protein
LTESMRFTLGQWLALFNEHSSWPCSPCAAAYGVALFKRICLFRRHDNLYALSLGFAKQIGKWRNAMHSIYLEHSQLVTRTHRIVANVQDSTVQVGSIFDDLHHNRCTLADG